MQHIFTGFTPDTYMFLMEIGFNNEKSFYYANKERYYASVKQPLERLAMELEPVMRDIDPEFNLRPTSVISRIYRDTRYTKNKLPYRDHAWLGYKYEGNRVSESFSMYFEIDTQGYGYGMGMYGGNPELMGALRSRAYADSQGFLALAEAPALSRYRVEGDAYKRDHMPDAQEALKPYLNRKGLSWCFYSNELSRTMQPELADEVINAMRELAPMYRYVTGK